MTHGILKKLVTLLLTVQSLPSFLCKVILSKHPTCCSLAVRKKSYLIPSLVWLSLSVCYCSWNFFFSSGQERNLGSVRWQHGVSKPLWNNACKHKQCISQVMRFSTLNRKPSAPKRDKQNPISEVVFRRKALTACSQTLIHSGYICLFIPSPFSFLFLLLSSESGQPVCMQIRCLEEPPAQHTLRKYRRVSKPKWWGKQHSIRRTEAGTRNLFCPSFLFSKYCVYSATGSTSSPFLSLIPLFIIILFICLWKQLSVECCAKHKAISGVWYLFLSLGDFCKDPIQMKSMLHCGITVGHC